MPRDTLTIPPADGSVRVSSPEEAEAAELALRERAGSVGATSVLVIDGSTARPTAAHAANGDRVLRSRGQRTGAGV